MGSGLTVGGLGLWLAVPDRRAAAFPGAPAGVSGERLSARAAAC